uniref:Dynein axonemal light chain 1 n=1 Tax=Eptatretus burgeri TaxID=7764 RepID=A0A8C4Q6X2_EPTBU
MSTEGDVIHLLFTQGKVEAQETTVKQALAKWETLHKQKASEALEVNIYGQTPFIKKMDTSLSTLQKCEKLSLSTNQIKNIANLQGLKNLKILSLGRNLIVSLNGLAPVADTLEQLWISYNAIMKLTGIGVLKNLKVLYMCHNKVKDWVEFDKLSSLPLLEELLFHGNPLEKTMDKETYRSEAAKKLPRLRKLDGLPIIADDDGSNM